ncbi:MAG TPA: 2Fe-2S iron-sulfur cluster-binding protein [Novosphingobium sp.]
MPKVTYIDHDGTTHEVQIDAGENIMRGAVYNGIEGIVGECGGGLACATCHCYVDEAWLDRIDPPSEAEVQMLESAASEVKPNSRLSCQIPVNAEQDGIVVTLPEKQY